MKGNFIIPYTTSSVNPFLSLIALITNSLNQKYDKPILILIFIVCVNKAAKRPLTYSLLASFISIFTNFRTYLVLLHHLFKTEVGHFVQPWEEKSSLGKAVLYCASLSVHTLSVRVCSWLYPFMDLSSSFSTVICSTILWLPGRGQCNTCFSNCSSIFSIWPYHLSLSLLDFLSHPSLSIKLKLYCPPNSKGCISKVHVPGLSGMWAQAARNVHESWHEAVYSLSTALYCTGECKSEQ